MKVVRKGKCDSGPVKVMALNIVLDTVFSGVPVDGVKYDSGVFLRVRGGFVRLAYDFDEEPLGYFFSETATIEDYKELNAYLCIEE